MKLVRGLGLLSLWEPQALPLAPSPPTGRARPAPRPWSTELDLELVKVNQTARTFTRRAGWGSLGMHDVA